VAFAAVRLLSHLPAF